MSLIQKTALSLLLFAAPLSAWSQSDRDAEMELTKLAHRRAAALVSGEIDYVAQTSVDGATFVDAFGNIKTKADQLAGLRAGKLKWHLNRLDEVNVRVLGDTAVLTGLSTQKGAYPDGTPFGGQYRFTHTYIKRGGKWTLMAAHSSRMPNS